MKLLFASGNQHKVDELRKKLPPRIELITMTERGFEGEIDETGTTLEENAKIKAMHLFQLYHEDVIADDSGLEVDALNGAPGVYSARYAGDQCSFADNNAKLLRSLEGMHTRSARFKTVIHLIWKGVHHQFEGCVEGQIGTQLKGGNGFGYDPLFTPEGYDQTFAEMQIEDKNKISHRALAVEKLVDFLSSAT